MSHLADRYDPDRLAERLHTASGVTRELMSDVIEKGCRRFPSLGQGARTVRLARLVDAEAWADAALTLIELELPLWQVRRIVYDEGEWHCALSRQRELPDWLDGSIEARHADLALALLITLLEAQALMAPTIRTSVPTVSPILDPLYEPLPCEDFR